MSVYLQRATNVLSKINSLALISEDPAHIARTYGTIAFQQGSRLIQCWMQDVGLQTRVDAIGNVRGRLESSRVGAKTFVIASHMDTVLNAGKFDGPMGILMGLDLVEQLIQTGKSLPFSIELIAFSDEEGVRFHTTYLGSKVVAGSFDKIRETLLKTFAHHKSLSVQQTLLAMGSAVLKENEVVSEISLKMPNKHHILFNLDQFGMDNKNEIFIATDEPYGYITGTITRE